MTMDPLDPTPRVEGTSTTSAPADDATAKEKASQVATVAADEAANVKDTAVAATKDVASEAATQVSAVVGQTKQQLGDLFGQARHELQTQTQAQGQQAAGALSTLSDRLNALAEGRTDEAGPLTGMVSEAQSKVRAYADRITDAGPQGVFDDVASFARRRPALFLVGAGIVGFAAGRMVKAATASSDGGADAVGRPDEQFGLAAPATVGTLPPPSASLRESGGLG